MPNVRPAPRSSPVPIPLRGCTGRLAAPGGAASAFTLLELLVALALLGLLAGAAGLTLHTTLHPPEAGPAARQVSAARDSALRRGSPVTIAIRGAHGALEATALPDGRVIADPALGVDPLTGAIPHAALDSAR